MNEIITKKCTKCGKMKNVGDFYKYQNRCKKCTIEYTKEKTNKELKKEYDQARRILKADELKEQKRIYFQKNKERLTLNNKSYVQQHLENMREYCRKWKRNNKEKVNENTRNRRARIRGNGGKLSVSDWMSVLDKYGKACLKCGSTERIEVDHVIPIALGGRNEKENVQPLCRTCNARKNDKIEDYR